MTNTTTTTITSAKEEGERCSTCCWLARRLRRRQSTSHRQPHSTSSSTLSVVSPMAPPSMPCHVRPTASTALSSHPRPSPTLSLLGISPSASACKRHPACQQAHRIQHAAYGNCLARRCNGFEQIFTRPYCTKLHLPSHAPSMPAGKILVQSTSVWACNMHAAP